MGMARLAALALTLTVLAADAGAQDAASRDEVDWQSEPATLSVWNRPIVRFRATVGGNEPMDRVENARRRLEALSDLDLERPVARQPAHLAGADGFVVTVGGQPVFGVVEADIDPESTLTLVQLAERAEANLRDVVVARAEQRRPTVVLRGVGFSLLAILILTALIALIFTLRARIVRKVDSLLLGRQVELAGIDIVPTLGTVKRVTLRVVSWALVLTCVYLALVFILQQFPYTAPLGSELGAFLSRRALRLAGALVEAMPQLLMVLVVLLITRAVSVWVSRALAEVERGARTIRWLTQDQARATRRIAVGIVWLFGIASAYPLLPWAKSAIFQGMSVVLGVALSLASTGLVNQWISGLTILYSRSFRIGDFIVVGSVEGFVTEIGPLATKLRTMRREEITLPNAVLVSDRLANLTRLASEGGALLSTSIAIGYDVPWQRVRGLLVKAAMATAGVRREPGPRVLQWELSDFSVLYHLHVYLERPEDRVAVRSELHAKILDAFAVAGVQIMTPHFESQPSKPVVASTPALS
jgi:small-conductance mechanosensitive channel